MRESVLNFGNEVFALAGGVDAQVASRRNLANRLSALPLVVLMGIGPLVA